MNTSTESQLPLDDLAKLNDDGGMVKLVVGPAVVLLGVVLLIALLRFLQRLRERNLADRFYGGDGP